MLRGRGKSSAGERRPRIPKPHDANYETPTQKKKRLDHEAHIAGTTPEFKMDQQPRLLWQIDRDRGYAKSMDLCELTFGCDGNVPFCVGKLPGFLHGWLERYNLKNWGYRDGCTAVVLPYWLSRAVDDTDSDDHIKLAKILPTFCVVRGGRPHPTEAWPLFVVHDSARAFGSLALSTSLRTLDFSISRNQVMRTLEPSGASPRMRSNTHYSTTADLHVVVRLKCRAADIVAKLTSTEFVQQQSTRGCYTDVDNGVMLGDPMLRTRHEIDGISFQRFVDVLDGDIDAVATFYCVVITCPTVFLSSANARSATLRKTSAGGGRPLVSAYFAPRPCVVVSADGTLTSDATTTDRFGLVAALQAIEKTTTPEERRAARCEFAAKLAKAEMTVVEKEGVHSYGKYTDELIETMGHAEEVLTKEDEDRRQLDYVHDTFLVMLLRIFDANIPDDRDDDDDNAYDAR